MRCAPIARLRELIKPDQQGDWAALWSLGRLIGVQVTVPAKDLQRLPARLRPEFGPCPEGFAGYGGIVPVAAASRPSNNALAVCADCPWRNDDWHCTAVTDVMACSSCLRLAASGACPEGLYARGGVARNED